MSFAGCLYVSPHNTPPPFPPPPLPPSSLSSGIVMRCAHPHRRCRPTIPVLLKRARCPAAVSPVFLISLCGLLTHVHKAPPLGPARAPTISGNQRPLLWAALPHRPLPRTADPHLRSLQGGAQEEQAPVLRLKDLILADESCNRHGEYF